jgi:mannitol-1-/sugar-/sorbitol-6-phosphatase
MPHDHHMFQFDCNAVLFDLDGVLVDSRHCVERHWLEWANRHQLNTDKVLHYTHGRRKVETIRIVAPHLDAEREAAELEASEVNDTAGLAKIPGALELVQSIPADAWGIATSATHAIASTRLAFGGLPVPDVLICADDVVEVKPNPEAYLFAALMLGVKPASCVVIEDAPSGIQAGRAAGMHVIGLISSAYPAEELSQANVLVRKLADIEVVDTHGVGLMRLVTRVKGV